MFKSLSLFTLLITSTLVAAEPSKTEEQINRSTSGWLDGREFRPFVTDGERLWVAAQTQAATYSHGTRLPETLREQKLHHVEIRYIQKKIRVLIREGISEVDQRPIISFKRLIAAGDAQIKLTNSGNEKASDFALDVTKRHVIRPDDVEVMLVRYELLSDGKPSGKYLALAPLPPGETKPPELREVILGTTEQAIIIKYTNDRGTSGK